MSKRRDFITLLGGAAAAWPLAAHAQQAPIPAIGYMSARAPEESAHLLAASAAVWPRAATSRARICPRPCDPRQDERAPQGAAADRVSASRAINRGGALIRVECMGVLPPLRYA
jgi:hypothetical protein